MNTNGNKLMMMGRSQPFTAIKASSNHVLHELASVLVIGEFYNNSGKYSLLTMEVSSMNEIECSAPFSKINIIVSALPCLGFLLETYHIDFSCLISTGNSCVTLRLSFLDECNLCLLSH